jgi:hypothetical protein
MSCLCCAKCCSCCERGGFLRQIPKQLIRDESGRLIRANLMFAAQNWCYGVGPGICDDIPEEFVTQYGLDKEVLSQWLYNRPIQINKRYRASCVCETLGFLTQMTFFCFLPCFCAGKKRTIGAWDKELREWQASFNSEVLEKKGFFCKTQSKCTFVYRKDGRDKIIERWLSIAFTPEAVEALKAEFHILGDVDDCSCLGGVNESELCMHP